MIPVNQNPTLKLAHDLSFEDLYRREGLMQIDALFLISLKAADEALHKRLLAAREDSATLAPVETSALLMDVAFNVEHFLCELFGVQDAVQERAEKQHMLTALYDCKRQFVQRAAKNTAAEESDGETLTAAMQALCGKPFDELHYAEQVLEWLTDPKANADFLDTAARYAAWAIHTRAGRQKHAQGVLFKLPHKLDFHHLVPLEIAEHDEMRVMRLPREQLRLRQGFKLTDPGADLRGAIDQANYCIWCHKQGRDSCSTGLKDKKSEAFKKSPLGVTPTGCPLEEKISEMNLLMSQGNPIGALAMVVVDNPMVAGTGHRICNDCMKSCIYQRQDPVDIPQIETRMLKEVLNLPWGFEIYSLLTRWNPLNLNRPLPAADSGYKV
ncbi:MAG: hypothetical protein Q9M27_02585, partial [Mariprofundaceae bacterium]|nr:hypothetical protein [Mariprofundaceae bacterium]